MSLEQTIQDLDKTLQELTGSVIEIVKYLNTPQFQVQQIKVDIPLTEEMLNNGNSKPKKKAKTVEQPIVVNVPVGSLDGQAEDEEETIVEAIEAEVVKADIQPIVEDISLEELQTLAKDLVAKDGGDSTRAKWIITKYAEKISLFTPKQRTQAAEDLTNAING